MEAYGASQAGDSRAEVSPRPSGKTDGEAQMDLGTFMSSYFQPGASGVQGLYNAQLLQQGNFHFPLPPHPHQPLLQQQQQPQPQQQQQQAAALSQQSSQLASLARLGAAETPATAGDEAAERARREDGTGEEPQGVEGDAPASRKRGRPKAQRDAQQDPEHDQGKPPSLQEKNRRAQQRFRQRQKERVEELQGQVDELESQLQSAKSEKTALQNHSNILEKVLANKDEDIQSMTQRLRVLEAQEGGAAASKDDSLKVTDSEGRAVTIARARLADELSNLWRGFVNKLAGALVEGGSVHPRAEVIEKIDKLVGDACSMCRAAALFEPNTFKAWVVSSAEEDETSHLLDLQQRWKDIVRSLTLTPQQKREIKELRRMHLGKLEALMFETKKLRHIPTAEEGNEAEPLASLTTMQLAKQYLVQDDIAAAMTNVVRQQNNMQLDFDATLYRGILTSLQMARVIVQSYPLVPDGLGIVHCVSSHM